MRVRGIHHRYPGPGSFELGPLDLDGPDDRPWLVLGPTGSGKSTLLRILGGSLRPQRRSRRDPEPLDTRDAAYLPQLPERALGGRNLAEDLSGIIRPRGDQRVILRRALEDVGLRGIALSRRSLALSAGERRRVALALLRLSGARSWALDEPEAALDAGGCRDLQEVLLASHRRGRVRRLWIATHRFELYGNLRPWAVVLDRGRLVGQGDVRELLGDPRIGAALGIAERAPFRIWDLLRQQVDGISTINLTDPPIAGGRIAQVKALLADRAGVR